jgi:hypothetical protein
MLHFAVIPLVLNEEDMFYRMLTLVTDSGLAPGHIRRCGRLQYKQGFVGVSQLHSSCYIHFLGLLAGSVPA